jgi:hypothetical protein
MTPEERFERIERTLDQIATNQNRTDARLDRAVRLSVREARAERARRTKANSEFDEKITQLAAAQLVTEDEMRSLKASVQAFIDSLRRGGNGHN